jgi:hypothetical protein
MVIKNYQKLVGKRLEDVERKYDIRVMSVDGKSMMGTCEYNPTRINVRVERGIITSIICVG